VKWQEPQLQLPRAAAPPRHTPSLQSAYIIYTPLGTVPTHRADRRVLGWAGLGWAGLAAEWLPRLVNRTARTRRALTLTRLCR